MPWMNVAPTISVPKEALARTAELFGEQLLKIWKEPEISANIDGKDRQDG